MLAKINWITPFQSLISHSSLDSEEIRNLGFRSFKTRRKDSREEFGRKEAEELRKGEAFYTKN
jgi:hypothetical protein